LRNDYNGVLKNAKKLSTGHPQEPHKLVHRMSPIGTPAIRAHISASGQSGGDGIGLNSITPTQMGPPRPFNATEARWFLDSQVIRACAVRWEIHKQRRKYSYSKEYILDSVTMLQ
jgi:hypothetical protein